MGRASSSHGAEETLAMLANSSRVLLCSLRTQLVLGPLSKLDDNSCRSLYVLVVDALDECENENEIRIILSLFSEARLLDTVRLKIFITSRPEVPIRHGVYQIPEAEHQDFVLHNISPAIVDHDITIFLEHELGFIGQERALGAEWPGGEVIHV
jgi:hypothetical protein